jgi:hypothetical protein
MLGRSHQDRPALPLPWERESRSAAEVAKMNHRLAAAKKIVSINNAGPAFPHPLPLVERMRERAGFYR